MEEVLGVELIISEAVPKINVNGDDRLYYFDIGIQRIEITRTKTINQIIWETVSVIADEIISKVTEEKIWEYFFKESNISDWYRVDGNTIYVECEDIKYLLFMILDSDRWYDLHMEELLTQNGYEVKEGNYADYQGKYISLPAKADMADNNGDRIWLVKWKYDYGWILWDRPRIEVLTSLAGVECIYF